MENIRYGPVGLRFLVPVVVCTAVASRELVVNVAASVAARAVVPVHVVPEYGVVAACVVGAVEDDAGTEVVAAADFVVAAAAAAVDGTA